ncbi:MAG TPA: protein kinase [Candidatus Limnocylindrales bacterium]|nr:protein kinase [Candidatus Limnocylindrales bacterium]
MELEILCMGCMEEKTDRATVCSRCGWTEGTAPDSPLYLLPRTVLLEKYLIGRVLGQGGFGITYLAWDLNLNLKLAIKEYFPQDLASRVAGHSQVSAYTGSMGSQYEYGLDKFLQEARTLAQFEDHPNIISVRDFFKANGTAYFVMSYVEGITLKEHLANSGGKLPLDQALGIIMPVMDALKEVHAANILHRDISPDNVFINRKGQVILLDFGAARQAIGEKGRSLSIILKPGYAPEEQYRSKGVQGPWTDIYAVSATMYHLIAGQHPPEALERLVDDTLIPPSQLGADIDETEEQAMLKALAVRAPDRFQTVQEFQAALMGERLVAAVKPPLTPASTAGTGVVAPVKQKTAPLGLIFGLAAVVVIGIAVIALWFGGVFTGGTTTAIADTETADSQSEIAPPAISENNQTGNAEDSSGNVAQEGKAEELPAEPAPVAQPAEPAPEVRPPAPAPEVRPPAPAPEEEPPAPAPEVRPAEPAPATPPPVSGGTDPGVSHSAFWSLSPRIQEFRTFDNGGFRLVVLLSPPFQSAETIFSAVYYRVDNNTIAWSRESRVPLNAGVNSLTLNYNPSGQDIAQMNLSPGEHTIAVSFDGREISRGNFIMR